MSATLSMLKGDWEQNIGNIAPVKVPCAQRQEFGFKLLFVPDKSALTLSKYLRKYSKLRKYLYKLYFTFQTNHRSPCQSTCTGAVICKNKCERSVNFYLSRPKQTSTGLNQTCNLTPSYPPSPLARF